jgi:hypothetical protein
MSSKITQDILESYVFCRSKGYLQWTGEYGMPSDYAMFLTQSRDEVRRKAIAKMLAQPHKDQVVQGTLLTTTVLLPVNLSVMICRYAATCWGNHSCSHCWLSSTTFKMPSALLPVGLQLIPLCF